VTGKPYGGDLPSNFSLFWRRFREQGFYLLLVLPVVLLLAIFFLAPLGTMLARSFQGGSEGILVENELGVIKPNAPSTVQLRHSNVMDLNGNGKVDAADVRINTVRNVQVSEVDADRGTITLAEPLPSGALLFVAYNSVERELLLRRPAEGRTFNVRSPPLRNRSGGGKATAADVRAWIETPMIANDLDSKAGVVTLPRPAAPGELVYVTYRYSSAITLAHYTNILQSNFYWSWNVFKASLFRTTFEIALFTTLGCAILGYPVAYLLANVSARWRTILIAFVIVPFWTSILVRTFAWQVILGNAGLVNFLLITIGATDKPLPMVFNRFGVYVGMIQVLIPFLILPAFAVMRGIPEHPLKAAASLGASPFWVFLRVYLPLSAPGVWAGSLIVFIQSLGFFVTPALLGGGADRMVSNIIAEQFETASDWALGSALAFVLLAPTVVLYVVYLRIVRSQNLYAVGGKPIQIEFREADAQDSLAPHAQRWRRTYFGWHLNQRARAGLLLSCGTAPVGASAIWIYEAPPLLLAIGAVAALLILASCVLLSRLTRVPVSRLVLGAFSGIVLIYLTLPNIVVIPISFTHHPVFLSFPGTGFTLENFAAFFDVGGAGHFGRGGWIPATLISLQVAAMVVVVSVPLGSLASYGLVRGEFFGRNVIGYLAIMPLIVPTLVIAISLFMFFSHFMPFLLGSAASWGPLQLPLGFVIAHSLLAIPYVIVIMSAAFKGINPILEHAAMSLGADRLKTIRRVVLPQVLPALVSSAFFAFLISFDELIIAIFLSTPQVRTLPQRLWEGVHEEVDPTIAAVATLLVVVTLVILSAVALIQRRFEARTG
jgi:putative spermidine/putrescine transport system permease protein